MEEENHKNRYIRRQQKEQRRDKVYINEEDNN